MLNIDNLHAGYNDIAVLHGLSLKVEPGQIVAVLGANGAGKTTLMNTLSGLLRTMSGSVHFEGAPIQNLLAERIVAMGISHVPQGRRVFPGPDGPGEPAWSHAQPRPRRRRAATRRARAGPRIVPAPKGAQGPARLVAVGRRAADARGVASARCSTEADLAGRTIAWSGAFDLRGAFLGDPRNQASRRHDLSRSSSRMPNRLCASPITFMSWSSAASSPRARRLRFLVIRPSKKPIWGPDNNAAQLAAMRESTIGYHEERRGDQAFRADPGDPSQRRGGPATCRCRKDRVLPHRISPAVGTQPCRSDAGQPADDPRGREAACRGQYPDRQSRAPAAARS